MTIHIVTHDHHAYRCPHCPYAARWSARGITILHAGDGAAHTGALPWWIARARRWVEARER